MGLQYVSWCRNDQCARVELHLAHDEDFDEDYREHVPRSKSQDPPWKRPASKALDHSIAKAVSKTYPKHLNAILREVKDDYGSGASESALYRAVQRHLAVLVERGHILKIDLGRHLYAYLRPGSTLVNDVEMMREQIESMMESTAGVGA